MESVISKKGVIASAENLGLRSIPGWIAQSFKLWRLSPFKYTLLSLAPLVAEGLLQLVPEAGVLLSKVLAPMVAAGILLGVDQLARTGKLSWRCVLAGFLHKRLGGLVLVATLTSLAVFATQISVASWVYGGGRVFDAVVLGHMSAHPGLRTHFFTEVLIVPGVVPATLLALVIPFFLFEDMGVLSSLGQGVRRLLSVWSVFAAFLVLNAALFAVALLDGPSVLLLLVVMPWSTLFTYVVYRAMAGKPLR